MLTLEDTTYNNEVVHRSKIFIQSNPNIPFYSLRAVFTSLMEQTFSEGRCFESSSKENDQLWGYQIINFNAQQNDKSGVRNQKWYDKKVLNDTFYINQGKVLDGSSLLFRTRQKVGKAGQEQLKVVMDLDIGTTHIRYFDRIENVKIKAVKKPVKTYYIEGYNDWKALYGLGGKFEGWFSADNARVPIKAQMNVYLGSINIELRKWKRVGWEPPI